MENKVKFRNHISIVAEKMGRTTLFWLIFVFGILIQDLREFATYTENGAMPLKEIVLVGGGVIIFIILIGVYQLVVWSKTYISIDDNSIVIEKNTWNVKKNTIGIQNISNVNMEQTLFEMLLGTCKLKLDTNSLSTADETDVNILLKKADAEQLQKYITEFLQQNVIDTEQTAGAEVSAQKNSEVGTEFGVEATVGDIMVHGFLSINIVSIVILIFSILGIIEMVMAVLEDSSFLENISDTLFVVGVVGMVLLIFISSAINVAKGFIRYYNFKIRRNENKLYIQYGLLKKINYTIPVDKINALRLKQSMFARFTGRYMAEIINIGMGDDEAEEQSFFLPYSKKRKLQKEIEKLLPEFSEMIRVPVSKQLKKTWIAWLVPYTAYFMALVVGWFVAAEFFAEYLKWILSAMEVVTAFVVLMSVLKFFTAGCTVSDKCIILANGYFQRRISYISYDKIQYVRLNQNPLAKICGIQKGDIFLLASLANRVHRIPYLKEKEVEELWGKIMQK